MQWSKWSISKHGNGKQIIRRYRTENGRRIWETLPLERYRNLNQQERVELMHRLNATFVRLSKKRIIGPYVNEFHLSQFAEFISSRSNSGDHTSRVLSTLRIYTIPYFIADMGQSNPGTWKIYEVGFGSKLLEHGLSAEHIKRIVQTANRFISFIADRFPREVARVKLEPLGGRVLRLRELNSPNKARSKFVSEFDFAHICKEIAPRLVPAVRLAYNFGFRRSEVLALTADCLYEDALLIHTSTTGLLKSLSSREVPYWFCTAEDAFNDIKKLKRIHADTLGRQFIEEMERLNLPYKFHDLRRTFITRALRSYHFLDVKLAAGHTDLKTTNRYIQDDRKLTRKKFVPNLQHSDFDPKA